MRIIDIVYFVIICPIIFQNKNFLSENVALDESFWFYLAPPGVDCKKFKNGAEG